MTEAPSTSTGSPVIASSARTDRGWSYACERHPGVPAWATCRACRALICRNCQYLDPLDHTSYCEDCVQTLQRSQVLHRGEPIELRQLVIAQGDGEALGQLEPQRLMGFFQSLRWVLFQPTAFFTQMHPEKSPWRAVLFGVFWSSFAVLGMMAAHMLITGEPHSAFTSLQTAMQEQPTELKAPISWVMLGMPLVAFVQVGFYGVFFHLMLMILGKKPKRIVPSIKIASYALAGQVFLLLPFEPVNALLARVFTVALLIIGIRNVHQTTFLTAALAVAIPTLFPGFLGLGFDNLVLVPQSP